MIEFLQGLDINWTTVAASAITAIIIGVVQLVTTRYTNRLLDRIDKSVKLKK